MLRASLPVFLAPFQRDCLAYLLFAGLLEVQVTPVFRRRNEPRLVPWGRTTRARDLSPPARARTPARGFNLNTSKQPLPRACTPLPLLTSPFPPFLPLISYR